MTDLEGSTRLWEQFPEAMRQAMARHDALIEAAVSRSQGVLVRPRGEGDSRFAVFPRASDAVVSATEIQRALFAEPWALPSPLRVRIAVHTGEADLRGGDYYGTAVNRCARLRSAGHGGQTLLSQATHVLVHDSLPAGVTVRDLGEHRLKDLRQPEHIYQLVIPGLPADFPPLASLESFRHNLPAAMTSFIGREREMAEVKRLLGANDTPDTAAPSSPVQTESEPGKGNGVRLLTITGSGGAGKTRLALQVAADLVDRYADGVWLVELAPLSNPELVGHLVATTLGIREDPERPIAQTLVEYLRSKHLLLILDNCEHLIAAVAQLAETLLRGAPNIQILATSREPLGMPAEVAWRIPNLSLPDAQVSKGLDRITQYEAVRLFVDRAVAVKPDFRVTKDNAPAIAQICTRLDGIPLAIELAAARVRVLSAAEIDARLDDRFRLLVGGSRTALPRQQTLRALIDWSYDLLSETERKLLRRLAVFAGGWTLEAAEEICADGDIDRAEILDWLTRLVDKSLVVAETTPAGERYHMLETIRQYSQARVKEFGEAEDITRRHAEYYARLAKKSYAELWGPRQGYWLTRLETEHDNLRLALAWAAADPGRAETLLYMTATLWRFWEAHGHFTEGREWLERALAANAGPVEQLSPRQVWYRANALRGAGSLARQQGAYEHAIALHQSGLELYRRVDDKLGIGRELDALGEIARFLGDYDKAADLHDQALVIRRQANDKEGIAITLANLAAIAQDRGDHMQARKYLEESLALAREINDQLLTAAALISLGSVLQDQSNFEQAIALYGQALEIYREQADRLGVSNTIQNLASAAKDQGRLVKANQLFSECLSLKRELGDRRGIARALAGLAEVAFYQGEYNRGADLARQSLVLSTELGVKRGVLLAMMLEAFISEYQGDLERAELLARQSLALSTAVGAKFGEAYSLQVLGLIAYARGDHDGALEQFYRVLDTFRSLGDRRNTAMTAINIARALYRQGQIDRAQQTLEQSLKLAREIGSQWSIAFSLEIMGLVERSQGNYDRALDLLRESLELSAEQANQQGILNCVGALAGLSVLTGDAVRAVRFYGATERIRESAGVVMAPDDRREYQSHLEELKGKLDPAAYRAAWEEGCSLTAAQLVQQALAG